MRGIKGVRGLQLVGGGGEAARAWPRPPLTPWCQLGCRQVTEYLSEGESRWEALSSSHPWCGELVTSVTNQAFASVPSPLHRSSHFPQAVF